ncbi:hypothetical protein SIN8267_01830 [Sinobacterium norvegicum]|uniref:CSD domain-containing protein n=1 Tax=Sinobacterium norvegicum TaxID=1641715 RepID=A0ABM9AET8_9GAMM|nr:DUF1294 domain-containing protein [Sinobacterium norvegicum]CAH0991716.1 hypothetical protein SIN8267_01830 [Sinobacterium norvegicum]
MKLQGKVINWNDDKGFGFVEPNGGGDRAFVHIKAFKPRSRRPVNGEVIIYELVRENNNRFKATNIKFSRDAKAASDRRKVKGGSKLGVAFTILFCIGLLAFIVVGKLSVIVAGLYVAMSLITFIAYAIDKSAAQNGRWRTKESTLHLFSTFGGWPGAYFAQNKLRHKSSKEEFKIVYWVTVFLNLGGFFWLHTEKGTNFLNHTIVPLLSG